MTTAMAHDAPSAAPTVTRMRTGMFSAEHGFYLATFLAVTVVSGVAVRFVCRHYCHCLRCGRKTHAPADDAIRISVVDGRNTALDAQNQRGNTGVIAANHDGQSPINGAPAIPEFSRNGGPNVGESINQGSGQNGRSNRRPIQWATPQLVSPEHEQEPPLVPRGRLYSCPSLITSSSFGKTTLDCTRGNVDAGGAACGVQSKEHLRDPRRSSICLAACTMQTVYEEEGSEELNDCPPSPTDDSSSSLDGTDQVTGIIYTFVLLPTNASPEPDRVPAARFSSSTEGLRPHTHFLGSTSEWVLGASCADSPSECGSASSCAGNTSGFNPPFHDPHHCLHDLPPSYEELFPRPAHSGDQNALFVDRPAAYCEAESDSDHTNT
ncbi:uncharacterized protein LOC108673293 [Hyalella azteca]|uniref:Uncharacterized protein LOC108673293 n=1 Tax=Hyalella azteca TaxID=294128 RepID=A0A8B7NS98_HYAAZ|nr:uncharacterized protein LOC108673293 [Hyalella azteca]